MHYFKALNRLCATNKGGAFDPFVNIIGATDLRPGSYHHPVPTMQGYLCKTKMQFTYNGHLCSLLLLFEPLPK